MTAAATTLLVLAKEPVPGRVKTRLCPPLTAVEAAEVAAAALADTLAAALRCSADRVLLALDGRPGPWVPAGVEVVAQRGATFAERLEAAWADAAGPTLQIGMDTPQVTPGLLDAGLAALDRHDGALGLAVDGGWWALALRTPLAGAFDHVPMSTSATGEAQLARLRDLGIDPVRLPPLVDIDTADDLAAVAAVLPATSRTALVHAGLRTRSHHLGGAA